jgi:hypothetical protein
MYSRLRGGLMEYRGSPQPGRCIYMPRLARFASKGRTKTSKSCASRMEYTGVAIGKTTDGFGVMEAELRFRRWVI